MTRLVTADAIVESALDYAGRGWKVVVLHGTQSDGSCTCFRGDKCLVKSRGKHPIDAGWQERATTDEATIIKELERHPYANVGVQMGPASRLVDIECDSPEAEQTYLQLFGDEGPPVTPTYMAKRGKHRLFRFRDDLPRKSNITIGDLEIRTGAGVPQNGHTESGQQSVFPPSVRHTADGVVTYLWLVTPDEADPAEIPDSVLARIAALDGRNDAATDRTSDVALDLISDALAQLNPKRADRYSDDGGWLDVGMAICHATGGSDDGLQLWDEWSKNSRKYEPGVCAEKWASFGGGNGHAKPLTVASLIRWAKQDSPHWASPQNSYRRADGTDPRDDWRAGREPRPIMKLSAGALIQQYQELNAPVVDPLFRVGEIVNVISHSKVGKSWLALNLAFSVMTGRQWLGRFQITPSRVLLIDNELHPATLAHRLKVMANAMGIRLEQLQDALQVWSLRGSPRDINKIGRDLGPLPPDEFALVIVDAWYRMFPPGVSENDNAAVTDLYNQVDQYAEQLRAAIVLIHHSSKGSQSDKRVTDVGAGAGAQSRSADCHLILREHEQQDCAVLQAALRSFPPVAPLALRWSYPLWTPADDLDPAAVKNAGQAAKDREGRDKILHALQDGPRTASMLIR